MLLFTIKPKGASTIKEILNEVKTIHLKIHKQITIQQTFLVIAKGLLKRIPQNKVLT